MPIVNMVVNIEHVTLGLIMSNKKLYVSVKKLIPQHYTADAWGDPIIHSRSNGLSATHTNSQGLTGDIETLYVVISVGGEGDWDLNSLRLHDAYMSIVHGKPLYIQLFVQ